MIVNFDDAGKNAKLALCQSELLPKLQMLSENIGNDPSVDA